MSNHWILLRGLVRGKGHWGSFVKTMEERFPGDNFEWLDLPGNGERNDVLSPINIHDYVKDLREQSQFVKEQKSFRLVAVSLGAMVAVEWMRSFPLEVEKGFLITTSASNFCSLSQRLMPKNYVKVFKTLGARTPQERERLILNMVANNPRHIEEELPALAEYSARHPVKQQNFVRQLLAAARYKFPADPPGNLKLIGSFGDHFVAPECTLQIAHKWRMKADMHPSAGHDIAIDDPHWLVEQLL